MKNFNFLKYLFLFGMLIGFGGGSFCGIVLKMNVLPAVGFCIFIVSFLGMCIGDSYFGQR